MSVTTRTKRCDCNLGVPVVRRNGGIDEDCTGGSFRFEGCWMGKLCMASQGQEEIDQTDSVVAKFAGVLAVMTRFDIIDNRRSGRRPHSSKDFHQIGRG